MPIKSKINPLPGHIKDELIKMLLTGETFAVIRQWLAKSHGIKISYSSIGRFGKATRNKFSVLVGLGMPIDEIVKHRVQIEAMGIEQTRQQLINELAERNGPLFAYLDKKEGKQ